MREDRPTPRPQSQSPPRTRSPRPWPRRIHGCPAFLLPRHRKHPLTRPGPPPSGHLATCLMACGVGKSRNIGLGRDLRGQMAQTLPFLLLVVSSRRGPVPDRENVSPLWVVRMLLFTQNTQCVCAFDPVLPLGDKE